MKKCVTFLSSILLSTVLIAPAFAAIDVGDAMKEMGKKKWKKNFKSREKEYNLRSSYCIFIFPYSNIFGVWNKNFQYQSNYSFI